MSQIIFICLSLLIFGSITNARFTDCSKDAIAELGEISVEGCDKTQYQCEMKMGQTFNISITFTTKELIKIACAKIQGQAWGKIIPMQTEKICENENSGVKCPLNQGLQFTYQGSATVPDDKFLEMTEEVDVYWRLVRDDEESKKKRRDAETPPTTEIVCVKIPIEIIFDEEYEADESGEGDESEESDKADEADEE